ncbi:MSCRAMM family protein [Parvimonas sp. C2]|uniref:MSCRAMM family protein n=1 Tax=Parvimonas sp. C2 TaxID=3110692 RepID=UPI002B4910B4|nr:SpaA isopeptide-forming pilin-related protein [Parvimonas sp. C2]MEB3073532.1 SpaA isopeptide-forming pilin-related protein [Parvimonas sp. C2]
MKKFTKNLISIVMAFVLLLNIGLISKTVFASETIDIFLISQKGKEEKKPIRDTKLKVWKLKDSYANKEKSEIIEKLKDLKDEDISKEHGNYTETSKSDVDGRITLSLEKGTYYVREVSDDSRDYKISPFTFKVPDDGNTIYSKTTIKIPDALGKVRLLKVSEGNNPLENVGFKLYMRTANGDVEVPLTENSYDKDGSSRILYTDKNGQIFIDKLPLGEYIFREVKPLFGYTVDNSDTSFKIVDENEISLKVINKKAETGDKLFVKVSSGNKPKFLEGAHFKVMMKDGDKFIPVKRDGKDYVVVSGKNGGFKVEDLPFGTYYLVETKAPKGYSLLSGSVEFKIDANSKSNEATIIKNKTFRRGLPKTGDILFLIMTLGGLVIFTTGYFISRKGKSKQN